MNSTIGCSLDCNILLRIIKACPTSNFSFTNLLELYMVIVSCIPHTLLALLGFKWILYKFSYVPYEVIGGVFTVFLLSFIVSFIQIIERNIEVF